MTAADVTPGRSLLRSKLGVSFFRKILTPFVGSSLFVTVKGKTRVYIFLHQPIDSIKPQTILFLTTLRALAYDKYCVTGTYSWDGD